MRGGTHPPHPLRPYSPVAINLALTGMVGGRDRVPHLPISPSEIVRDAWVCHCLGAAILHLHARDDEGRPAWQRARYAELVRGIRDRCPEAIVCVTTSGRVHTDLEQRGDVLSLAGDERPDMASLTLGSLNFATGPSVTAPDTIEALARKMREAGIRPELEIFEAGMAYVACSLLDRGIIERPLYANLILGSHHTMPATARDLAHLVDSLPAGATWAAGGIGPFQLSMNAMAIAMGGHVRTGLEDNAHMDQVTRAPATNSALVQRVARLARELGRRVATAREVRDWLGLPDRGPAPRRIRPAELPADREGIIRVLETANMHRVPSPEMDDFDVGSWFVAEAESEILGVAGFKVLREAAGLIGKTTLLAVHPSARGSGAGRELQELRMALMRDAGATRVITNADRPETIAWYRRHFGYRQVGVLPKLHEFGLPDVDRWTTLEADLE